MVAGDVHPGEIDGRVGQTEDIGTPSPRGFHLAVIGHDFFDDQFVHQFGDGGDTDVELFGELGQRTLPVDRHVGDDIAFNQVVLVDDAFLGIVFVLVEKFL